MSRGKRRSEAHVRLYRHELESPAYQSLSPEARALLIEFRALYGGRENRVYMSIRVMRKRLNNIGQVRAERARDELIDRGFIRMTTQGSFSRKCRHATEYALTHEPLENKDGAIAPKDFMRWRQKNTVSIASTDGTDSEYQSHNSDRGKHRHGSDNEYRQSLHGHIHGTDSEYTDRLPRGTEFIGVAIAADSNVQFKPIIAALPTSQPE